jgi:hypothetical protein
MNEKDRYWFMESDLQCLAEDETFPASLAFVASQSCVVCWVNGTPFGYVTELAAEFTAPGKENVTLHRGGLATGLRFPEKTFDWLELVVGVMAEQFTGAC